MPYFWITKTELETMITNMHILVNDISTTRSRIWYDGNWCVKRNVLECQILRCRVAGNHSMKVPQANRGCCDCISRKIIWLYRCRYQNVSIDACKIIGVRKWHYQCVYIIQINMNFKNCSKKIYNFMNIYLWNWRRMKSTRL